MRITDRWQLRSPLGRRSTRLAANRLLLIPPGEAHGFTYEASTVVSIKFETAMSGGGMLPDDEISASLASAIAAVGSGSTGNDQQRHLLLAGRCRAP